MYVLSLLEMSTTTRTMTLETVQTPTISDPIITKTQSFSDQSVFDNNSPPEITYVTGTTGTTVIRTTDFEVKPITNIVSTAVVGSVCDTNKTAWPPIILGIVGAIILIYTAVGPGIDTNRRYFGLILTFLWIAAWGLILWVLWRDCEHSTSWWLLIIPIALIFIFFMVVIVMNLGSSI